MNKTNNLVVLILFLTFNSFAQGFTFIDGGMVNVGRSSVAWADYDNDGDLDVLVTGDHGSGPYVASVYRNDGGEFNNINAGLTGIYNSAVAWGDYDNDGDLDILACGRNNSNSKTFLYQNNNGAFTQLEAGLPNIGSDGAIAWGDYDGDNDLDILIAGAYSCRIYANAEGAFADIGALLPAVSNCWVDWGDFDNDGDLDVFVMGDLGGILISTIYRNDSGIFTEMPQTGIYALAGGSSSWSDFDHDRDLDLLITGFNEYLEPQTSIFRNLGNMQFIDIYPGLIGAALGTAAWCDYDSDGETDILLTGQNAGCGILSSIVYHNEGNSVFTDINAPLDGAERGSAAWGDFDNDGDPDILISGITGTGMPGTHLYLNNAGSNTYAANAAPSVPEGLSQLIDGHAVTLEWFGSSDDHTPDDGITYNLRIGTAPGAQDVLPAMSDLYSGKRLIPQAGNCGNNKDQSLQLPDGTYYWSVQAIDHSFTASQFSVERSFTILNVGVPGTIQNIPAYIVNSIQDQLFVKLHLAGSARITISDLSGRILEDAKFEEEVLICTAKWSKGIYTVKIEEKGYPVYVRKLVK